MIDPVVVEKRLPTRMARLKVGQEMKDTGDGSLGGSPNVRPICAGGPLSSYGMSKSERRCTWHSRGGHAGRDQTSAGLLHGSTKRDIHSA